MKTNIKRVALASGALTLIVAGVMAWDYARTERDRDTCAALMETGKRIDFEAGKAFAHSTGETIVLRTLNRITPAGPRAVTLVFKSPIFGFEMSIFYTAPGQKL